jgi:hypothetical protein
MKSILNKLFKLALIVNFQLFLVSCDGGFLGSSAGTDYDKICNIAQEFAQQSMDFSTKEMKIAARVEKEFPSFFKQDYVNVLSADRDERYSLVKRLAEMETNTPWDCDVMKKYYSGDFDNP